MREGKLRLATGNSRVIVLFLIASKGVCAFSQTLNPIQIPTSVDANLLMDAAGPEQRKSLGAIYLIACPGENNTSSVGSGFLLNTGVMITNSHVVSTCTERTLFGIGTANKKVTFSKIIKDAERDLAILVPAEKLVNGLKIAPADNPTPGVSVTTWGYPFFYNGASPLLSVGYVSGYREAKSENGLKTVKHIVINGAFNHGNSGGPLLIAHSNEVIGIVVLTYNFYPPEIKKLIDQLSTQKFGMQWNMTRPDGSSQAISESQITAAILDEFYQKTQVMIGEAIAASELTALLKEHASELPHSQIEAPRTTPKPVFRK
jgi:S1-C subfamily serine protease